MFEQVLQFFLMFLLFLLDNFIATHLKSTDFAWVVFLYSFEPKDRIYFKWGGKSSH